MSSSVGTGSRAVVSDSGTGYPASMTIDLREPEIIQSIQLHTAEPTATFPMIFDTRYGVPHTLRVEGALKADFSDGELLVQSTHDNVYKKGSITSLQCQPVT